jgi:hypothetical protein
MQDRDHTFTIAMTPGDAPTVHGPYAYLKRATDIQALLKMFSPRLPRTLNMTFIMDDNPAVMLAYTERDRMVELASQGECKELGGEERRLRADVNLMRRRFWPL